MKNKSANILKLIILILFFFFVAIYLSDSNGYFAYSNYRKNVLTEQGIKDFEEDIKNGVAIDVKNYIEKEVDYSNNISRFTLKISNEVGGAIRKCLVEFFKRITRNIE